MGYREGQGSKSVRWQATLDDEALNQEIFTGVKNTTNSDLNPQ